MSGHTPWSEIKHKKDQKMTEYIIEIEYTGYGESLYVTAESEEEVRKMNFQKIAKINSGYDKMKVTYVRERKRFAD